VGGYQGYEIHANYGLMFIFNKNKTNRKKLEWLKKYQEALKKVGIKTTVYPDRHEPYMDVDW
jgi:hypothetical protein